MVTIILITFPSLTIIIMQNKITSKQYFVEKNTLVRVKRTETDTIETMPLEQYLIGVLAGEMPISYSIEALKAQAVAARTYTLKKIKTNVSNTYDVVDTINDQVYIDNQTLKNNWQSNFDENIKKIKQAINETSGEYLTYNDDIITAFFFSTSSGTTENCKDVFGEDLPYLKSVSSIWDQNSPSYNGIKTLTKEEFYKKLDIEYQEQLEYNISRNETNSINIITINGTQIKGTEFRKKLELKSTNIEIKEQNNEIIITSKGYGHGVGMSQYGALEMAKLGYKYDEILKYYYQGTQIKKYNV